MQARAVRVKIHDVRVRYHGEAAVLVDISRAGALLRVPRPSELDTQSTIGFDVGEEHMEVTGQVVRCTLDPDSLSTHRERWLIGVAFLTPSQHEITSMLHRLIEAHR
jgi:hypothetical protein